MSHSHSGSTGSTRPSFDQTFMAMAYVLSNRSPDPTTKHGAVLVDAGNAVISMGYNGPVRGVEVPQGALETREPGGKYDWMIHAEDNAICFADPTRLDGATLYVTGRPCTGCGRRALQHGVTRIVYGGVTSVCTSGEGQEAKWSALLSMAKDREATIEAFDMENIRLDFAYRRGGAGGPYMARGQGV